MDKLYILPGKMNCSTVVMLYEACLKFENIKTSSTCQILKKKLKDCRKKEKSIFT